MLGVAGRIWGEGLGGLCSCGETGHLLSNDDFWPLFLLWALGIGRIRDAVALRCLHCIEGPSSNRNWGVLGRRPIACKQQVSTSRCNSLRLSAKSQLLHLENGDDDDCLIIMWAKGSDFSAWVTENGQWWLLFRARSESSEFWLKVVTWICNLGPWEVRESGLEFEANLGCIQTLAPCLFWVLPEFLNFSWWESLQSRVSPVVTQVLVFR